MSQVLRRRPNWPRPHWRNPGSATALLDILPPDELAISVFVVCELLIGAALHAAATKSGRKSRRSAPTCAFAYPDEAFADDYGRIVATLKRSGRDTGAMDLLIATAASRDGARLVTRDRKDFLSVEGLETITY